MVSIPKNLIIIYLFQNSIVAKLIIYKPLAKIYLKFAKFGVDLTKMFLNYLFKNWHVIIILSKN